MVINCMQLLEPANCSSIKWYCAGILAADFPVAVGYVFYLEEAAGQFKPRSIFDVVATTEKSILLPSLLRQPLYGYRMDVHTTFLYTQMIQTVIL